MISHEQLMEKLGCNDMDFGNMAMGFGMFGKKKLQKITPDSAEPMFNDEEEIF